MTDERRLADDGPDSGEDSRRQLWFRAGVAGGLIALLLGALAVFDHLSKPRGSEEVALPTKPIAPAQVASDAGRDAPPEVIRAGSEGPQAGAAEEQPAEATVPPMLPRDSEGAEAPVDRLESPRVPTARPHQAAPSAHGREVEHRAPARGDETPRSAAVPVPAAPPVTPPAQAPRVPAAAAPALVQQTSPAPQRDLPPAGTVVAPRPAGSAPTASPAPAVAASAAAQPQSGAAPAPVAGMPARTGAAAPVAAQAAAAPAEAPARGYVLQFGFFSSVARAEELKARMAQAGIPAQVETRLVVGPFADRREALAAQSRLREKGIDTGVLLPLGR